MSEIYDFTIAAGGNSAAPPNGFPEFMEYAEVNNSARELMAALRRWQVAGFSGITSAGSGTAYTLASGQTFASYLDGMLFAFKAHVDSTGPATLNVDAKGALPLVDVRGVQFTANDVRQNGVYVVSKQGANFVAIGALTATSIAALALGSVTFRTVLTAPRTYYVRVDGNDANTGLTDSAGGAFLTVQRAIDVVFNTLDLAGFNVDIQVRDGLSYGGIDVPRPQVGRGTITVRGNAVTPANVRLSTTGIGTTRGTISVRNGAFLNVQDFEVRSTTSGHGLHTSNGGAIQFQNLVFGACAEAQMQATQGGYILCAGAYAISGGAAQHLWANSLGEIRIQSQTITLTGTPAFSTAFAQADYNGVLTINGNTWTGAATGPRFLATNNGTIVALVSVTELPGSAAGVVSSGGIYPSSPVVPHPMLPSVSGLTIANNAVTPNTQLDVSCADAILNNSAGDGLRTGARSFTINASTTGLNGLDTGTLAANTWYYVYLISNGSTGFGALLSLSSTAPTLPATYTFAYRVGAIRTGPAATFTRILQKGNWAKYVVAAGSPTPNLPIMASGATGSITTPTYTAVAVANFVPPTANQILGVASAPIGTGTLNGFIAAPNNSYGAYNSTTNPPPVGHAFVVSGSSGVAVVPFSFVLESTNIHWAAVGANSVLTCSGWVDTVNAC